MPLAFVLPCGILLSNTGRQDMAKHCRIILKRISADSFYKAPRRWVKDRGEAVNFGTVFKAQSYCVEHELKDVLILMDFGKPELDVKLSVH